MKSVHALLFGRGGMSGGVGTCNSLLKQTDFFCMSKQMDLYRELSDSGVTDRDDPCSLCMKMSKP